MPSVRGLAGDSRQVPLAGPSTVRASGRKQIEFKELDLIVIGAGTFG